MPIDRNDSLRRAEKLLRQGRLDAAIAEYSKVAVEFPTDLATANLLGDLHLRAGHVDRAVAQYTRMADHLAREGFVPKAVALYRKIIKIRPDDDNALLRMTDLAIQQGLVADARVCLQALYEARLKRGDRQGAAEVAVRRVEAEPADVAGRLDAARLLAELGSDASAGAQWREAAFELFRRGRPAEGVRALGEALGLNDLDEAARERLVDAHLEAGDLNAAAEAARTAGQAGRVATALLASGRGEAAVAFLARARETNPGDAALGLELARTELALGRTDEALAVLPAPAADETTEVALLRVEVLARAGRVAEAKDLIRRSGDAGAATDLLQRLADVSPDPVEALRQLIEVCEDLADEDGVYRAQVRLADALLDADRFAEARVLTELLIEKRPDVGRHADRLSRAVDGLAQAGADLESVRHSADTGREPDDGDDVFEIDLNQALDDLLGDQAAAEVPPPSAAPDGLPEPVTPPGERRDRTLDLDGFFRAMRSDAGVEASAESASRSFDMASQAYNEGRLGDAEHHLQQSSRDPAFRFRATALLARIARDGGRIREAIDWLERAAESPVPSAGAGDALLHDLGSALEEAGEFRRALAVFMELQIASPGYRDVDARVARLTSYAQSGRDRPGSQADQ